MTHPQDVAVPSLPEPYDGLIPCGDDLGKGILDGFTADQMHDYARAAVIADRAAGCAAAEPEGVAEFPDAGELESWRATADDLLRASSDNAGLTRRAAFLLQNAYLFAKTLAATPTPTASIAPKAEGEAELARGEVPSFESWWESWPFQAYKNELTKAAAHHAYRAGKAIGEGLTDCQNCLGDGKDGDVDDYGRMVGFDCHQCNGTGKVLRAAPVAQAATGAEDLRYEVLESKVRDLLHLLSFADIKTPSEGDAEQAAWVMANIRGFINGARPEADADRASGGGV